MQNNFLSPLLFVLVLALALLSVVAIFYLYITAKNRERLALIAKGMNPNLANSSFWPQVGIIVAGIGAGLNVGDLLNTGANAPLMAIFGAAVGLVIFHALRKLIKRKESKI